MTNFDDLKKMMKNGVVAFDFLKKDGTIRRAHGTLDSSMLPPMDTTKTSTRKPNPNVFVYYDIDKESFRSFIKDNFIGLVEE